MKIIALGKLYNYKSFFLQGVIEGTTQNGWEAIPLEFIDEPLDRIKEIIISNKSDYIFCHMAFSNEGSKQDSKLQMLREVKEKTGTKIFYHMGDPRVMPRYEGNVSNVFDGALMGSVEWEGFKIWGIPLYYWPYGCFKQDKMIEREQIYDLIFTGTLSINYLYQDRTRFIRMLGEHFNLEIFPSDNHPENTSFDTSKMSALTRGVINVQGRHDIDMYFSVRPFQYCGAGALNFQMYGKGMEKVFEDKKHLLFIRGFNVDEVKELYKYYIEDHPKEGHKIREQAFKYCQKNHTYQIRMKDLIEVIEGKRDRVRYLLEDFK